MTKPALLLFAFVHVNSSFAQTIADQFQLDVGENTIYAEVAGPSNEASIIVYLHGGPGNVALGVSPFRENIGSELEKKYLLVYMHQRGVGNSTSVPEAELTIPRHVSDVASVVDFVTARYEQDKVTLIGHSWGGMLGMFYAIEYQEKVESLVLIASPINSIATYQDSLEVTLRWARDEGHEEAISQLTAVDATFENVEDRMTVNRWANQAYGGIGRTMDMQTMLQTYDVLEEYPNWANQQRIVSEAMRDEIGNVDLTGAIRTLDIPALFIAGGFDSLVPQKSVFRDFESYDGQKSFVLLEDSHHLPYIDQPAELTESIEVFLSE
ncbi:MAG: alpha/beta hydrolase [Pseudomonadales bacterium]|nr:alpha/beta hydrolase [Pseudomonadales bacterium]